MSRTTLPCGAPFASKRSTRSMSARIRNRPRPSSRSRFSGSVGSIGCRRRGRSRSPSSCTSTTRRSVSTSARTSTCLSGSSRFAAKDRVRDRLGERDRHVERELVGSVAPAPALRMSNQLDDALDVRDVARDLELRRRDAEPRRRTEGTRACRERWAAQAWGHVAPAATGAAGPPRRRAARRLRSSPARDRAYPRSGTACRAW